MRTQRNSISSTSNPTIQHGGQSSSEQLRNIFDNITADHIDIQQRLDEQDHYIRSTGMLAKLSNNAMGSMIQSIEAQFGPTGMVSGAVADFYTDKYVVAAGTTATIHNTFGQATLRVNSTQQKLVFLDSANVAHIPDNLGIYYSYGSDASDMEYLRDPDGRYAVDGHSYSIWAKSRGTTGFVYVRIVLPGSLNQNKLTNSLCLYPFPLYGLHVYGVWYRQSNGDWIELDKKYSRGYNADTGTIYNASNMRFIFPAVQATEFKVKLQSNVEDGYWGFKHIKAELLEFDPTSTLTLEYGMHGPGSITKTILRGKDESSLDYISRSVVGSQVSMTIPQTAAGTSPVITSVESFWWPYV